MEYFEIRKFGNQNLRTWNCAQTANKLSTTFIQNSSSNIWHRENYYHCDFQSIFHSELDTDNYKLSTSSKARLDPSTQLFFKLAVTLSHACNWHQITWSRDWLQPAGGWSSWTKIQSAIAEFRVYHFQSTRRLQVRPSECRISVYFRIG